MGKHRIRLVVSGRRKTLLRMLVMRAFFVFAIITVVFCVLYIDKSGLADESDGVVDTLDVLYFTVITVTTVGYGDIVPVSRFARMFDAFAVTFARLLIWFTLLRTTYEIALARFIEGLRMKRLKERLQGHVIVCGYGQLGRATVSRLIEKGFPSEQIVVLDVEGEAAEEAADAGIAALHCDATKEDALRAADIENAKALVAATGRDDTNILICLTAKSLAPDVCVLGRVKEAENLKLMIRSGADRVISPEQIAGDEIANHITSS